MRIIGGSDYYDGVQAYGQDRELVFVRTPFDRADVRPAAGCGLAAVGAGTLLIADGRLCESDIIDNRHCRIVPVPGVVWFAGRRHPFVRMEGISSVASTPALPWYAWSADEVRRFLDGHGVALLDRDRSLGESLAENNIDGWFGRDGGEAEKRWLAAGGVSIAVSVGPAKARGYREWRRGAGWKFDTDGLGAMGFARVVPTWDAYQELSMWAGGVVSRPGAPTAEIASDAIRRDKHGFDMWSFRRRKQDGKVDYREQ